MRLPNFTKHNTAYSRLANAILASKGSLANLFCSIPMANCCHILLSKFGFVVRFAMHSRPSILSKHITHIVAMRAKKQVSRIDTGGIVTTWAVVANTKSFWNRAIDQLPRYSVGRGSSTISFGRPIPIAFATNPEPTSMRARSLVNLRPKSLYKLASSSNTPALPRTANTGVISTAYKYLSTHWASLRDRSSAIQPAQLITSITTILLWAAIVARKYLATYRAGALYLMLVGRALALRCYTFHVSSPLLRANHAPAVHAARGLSHA